LHDRFSINTAFLWPIDAIGPIGVKKKNTFFTIFIVFFFFQPFPPKNIIQPQISPTKNHEQDECADALKALKLANSPRKWGIKWDNHIYI
jgi:hypothetical protein